MTPPCPPCCTVHADSAWTGPHYGDPIDIAVVIEHDVIPTPVPLVLARTASAAGECIQLEAEETHLPDLRLDLSAASRLARAIVIATGSTVDEC